MCSLLGIIPAIILVAILFAIHPLLGVLGILFFVGLGIYAWKKK